MNVSISYKIFFLQKSGGISRYFINLAKHLINFDVNVNIKSFIHQNIYLYQSDFNKNNLYFKKFPYFSRKIFNYINLFLSKSTNIISKPDLCHYTYYDNPILNNQTSIVTAYDFVHELFFKKYGLKEPYINKRKISFERVDHIICISKKTQEDLVNIYNIPVEKTSVIYLGVDHFSNKKNDSPINYDPYILYVGSRSKHKNFSTLLKSYYLSSKLKKDFRVICFGGGNFNKYEIAEINKLKLEKNIIYTEGDDDKLANLYKFASVLAYPSLYEGFGIPPLEALQFKCPSVVSQAGSMPEVLADSALFVSDPMNSEDWKDNIEKILYSEQIKNQIVLNGTKRVQLFSWSKCAEQTHALYKKFSKNKK